MPSLAARARRLLLTGAALAPPAVAAAWAWWQRGVPRDGAASRHTDERRAR